MIDIKDNATEKKPSLLSDADFVALMEAEFAAETKSGNDVSKRRIWRNIRADIDKRGIFNHRGQIYSVAATLFIVAIALPLFFGEFNPSTKDRSISAIDIERTKGVENGINVDLSVFTLNESGKLTHSDKQHEVGTTLLFKVHSTRNGVATIISSRNGNLVSSEFIYSINQKNSGQLISNNDQVYGYMIEPMDKIIQFCVIAATDKNQLNEELNNLTRTWAGLPANACATINVTNSLQ